MLSICGNDALRELSSPGKSGSFFYLTNDDRYMIKTMKKSEAKVSHEVFCMHISVRKSTLAISHGQITFWFYGTGAYKDASCLLQPCQVL